MTVYGYEETPDYGSDDLTIRPANADEVADIYTPAPARNTGGEESLFDQLLGLAEEEVTNVQRFPVTFRKGGWVLEFDCIISEADIKRYRKGSLNGRKKLEDADRSVGSAMILHEKCTGIYKTTDGELKQVLTPEGEPLVLDHPQFTRSFGPNAPVHVAVRKFLGDAETNTLGDAVLKAAGWSEDLEPLDPTEA